MQLFIIHNYHQHQQSGFVTKEKASGLPFLYSKEFRHILDIEKLELMYPCSK